MCHSTGRISKYSPTNKVSIRCLHTFWRMCCSTGSIPEDSPTMKVRADCDLFSCFKAHEAFTVCIPCLCMESVSGRCSHLQCCCCCNCCLAACAPPPTAAATAAVVVMSTGGLARLSHACKRQRHSSDTYRDLMDRGKKRWRIICIVTANSHLSCHTLLPRSPHILLCISTAGQSTCCAVHHVLLAAKCANPQYRTP